MVCLRNISVDTLHKGDNEDNNSSNNNNNNNFLICFNWLLMVFSPQKSKHVGNNKNDVNVSAPHNLYFPFAEYFTSTPNFLWAFLAKRTLTLTLLQF